MRVVGLIPHLPPRSILISFLVLLFLLGLGVTAVTAMKNSYQKAFQPTHQPTPQPLAQVSVTPFPEVQPPQNEETRLLPDSCYQDPESEQCEREIEELIDQECGGDMEGVACRPYLQEVIALASQQECQKDPNSSMCRCLKGKDPGECLGQEIRGKAFAPIFCELAQAPFFGEAFRKLCREFSFPPSDLTPVPEGQTDCQLNLYAPECQDRFQSTCLQDPYTQGCEEYAEIFCLQDLYAFGCEEYCLQNPESPVCQQRCQLDINLPGCQEFLQNYCQFYPYDPGCHQYFEFACAKDPYQAGCVEYCYQNPYTEGCLAFLVQYCRDNLLDSLCMDVLCDRAPNLCVLCQQFPNACEQILQRSF